MSSGMFTNRRLNSLCIRSITVFALCHVYSSKPIDASYWLQRPRSDCASAQDDPSLCWIHKPRDTFSHDGSFAFRNAFDIMAIFFIFIVSFIPLVPLCIHVYKNKNPMKRTGQGNMLMTQILRKFCFVILDTTVNYARFLLFFSEEKWRVKRDWIALSKNKMTFLTCS